MSKKDFLSDELKGKKRILTPDEEKRKIRRFQYLRKKLMELLIFLFPEEKEKIERVFLFDSSFSFIKQRREGKRWIEVIWRERGKLIKKVRAVSQLEEKEMEFFAKEKEIAVSEFKKTCTEILRLWEELLKERNELIFNNMGLVAMVVEEVLSYVRFLTARDLFQEGIVGIVEALERFDFSKRTKFGTYAFWWIQQRVKRAIANTDLLVRLPVYIREERHKLWNSISKLEHKKGRMLSLKEIQKLFHPDPSKLPYLLKEEEERVLSLETPFYDRNKESREKTTLLDLLPSSLSDPEKETMVVLKREAIKKAFKILTKKERLVLEMRFGLQDGRERTLDEVGKILGLTRERVRQIQNRALEKLRENKILKEFVGAE